MRKEFAAWMEDACSAYDDLIFLTGDLGFNALENLAAKMGNRFINAGVAEQNMVSVAAGMAQQGLRPFCYSIAPFIVFRPFEQIRLDVCIHNLDVKLVGNGGGYGYGIMGATHHALEDLAVMSVLPNMRCYVPYCNEDVIDVCDSMIRRTGPAYLRLGYGSKPNWVNKDIPYKPIRKIVSGQDCTVVGIGPVILNLMEAKESLNLDLDIFVVSELPLDRLGPELEGSIKATRKILVVEEHAKRGGLGEHLAGFILSLGITAKFCHEYSVGYPDGLYGSQAYHQRMSQLDPDSLKKSLVEICNA